MVEANATTMVRGAIIKGGIYEMDVYWMLVMMLMRVVIRKIIKKKKKSQLSSQNLDPIALREGSPENAPGAGGSADFIDNFH